MRHNMTERRRENLLIKRQASLAFRVGRVVESSTRLALLKARSALSLTEIADKMGVTQSFLSHVISKRRGTAWIKVALAQLADVPYSEFWGEAGPTLTERDKIKLTEKGFSK